VSETAGIALIGAGTVAEMHGRGVSAVANARLVGCYDLDASKAEHIAARFGGCVYSSLPELLADSQVSAVHVLTPVERHVEQAVAALQAGKHVLLEKPVAQTHAEIVALQAAAREAGRVCMPAHNYIYAPSIRRARRLIAERKLGRVASLWILYNIFHAPEVAAIYGGVLRAVCTHHAYSVLYLLGRPNRLMAMASRVHPGEFACEEQAAIMCEMKDGAIAHLWASFAANDPTNDPWSVVYKVLGTDGGVSYSWNEAQFNDGGGPAWGLPCYEESFIEEIDHFINRCILQGDQPLSTLSDAADALSILAAAERCISNPDSRVGIEYRLS
jgi:predicted dehydrogenase